MFAKTPAMIVAVGASSRAACAPAACSGGASAVMPPQSSPPLASPSIALPASRDVLRCSTTLAPLS
eukprot:scaffold101770_cov77-Phaeocystis_antarctica.AAC.1